MIPLYISVKDIQTILSCSESTAKRRKSMYLKMLDKKNPRLTIAEFAMCEDLNESIVNARLGFK